MTTNPHKKITDWPLTVIKLIFAISLFFGFSAKLTAEEARILHPLTIVTTQGSYQFQVELAKTPTQHAQGLMFRPSLPEQEGMLFVYSEAKPRQFWMKNTRIPLDIIFIDAKGEVINYEVGEPYSLDLVQSKHPARYVLELNLGVAERIGLHTGAQLQFQQ